MKAMIRDVLDSHLKGQKFVSDHTGEWTKDIANEIRQKLKDLGHERYKYMVQVVVLCGRTRNWLLLTLRSMGKVVTHCVFPPHLCG